MNENLSVLYVTPSVSRAIGGIYEVERNLALQLHKKGVGIDIVSLVDTYTNADLPQWQPLVPTTYPVHGPAILGFSIPYYKRLLRSPANLGHIHSLWSYTSVALYIWAKKRNMPYLVTPNGMLDDWALKNSKWKKDLALFAGVRKILQQAACIQVNTLHEYRSVRKFGLSNPVCKISNGVNLPEPGEVYTVPWQDIPAAKGKKIILYLSRIHPKKGAHLMLRAWEQLRHEADAANWHMVVVGFQFANDPYENQLISYVKENNLQNQVSFLPGQYGHAMQSCYAGCDVFILPSFSEGVPMAVLHAWSFGKAAIITAECNLEEGFVYNAAFRIEAGTESIRQGLLQMIKSPEETIRFMGEQGRKLVSEKFTWEAVASKLLAVYQWVHAGGPVPESVIQD